MQDRSAEDPDHSIADELRDAAAIGFHYATGGSVVLTQKGVDQLGILAFRKRGEFDQIAEQDGDSAALLGASGRV